MTPLESLQKIDRTQHIDSWNVRLYFLSRHPWVLIGIAAFVMIVATGAGWFLQKPFPKAFGGLPFDPETLKSELEQPAPDMKKVLGMLPQVSRRWIDGESVRVWIAASHLSDNEKLVAQATLTSMHEDSFEPNADLIYYAHYVRPLRYANELIGDYYEREGQPAKAAQYYQREVVFAEDTTAKTKLVNVLLESHDRVGLKKLNNNAAFVSHLRPEHRLYLAALDHRWMDLITPLRDLQIQMVKPVPATLAVIAGLVWLLIAIQSIQPRSIASFRIVISLFAVGLGMLSTFPTLLSGLWMEETLGLQHSEGIFENFLFFMLSVGPREELIKLAFVLPILAICLIRKNRLEMLIGAGCVGLGFAIWENLSYFANFGSAVAFPRFLTANFFHLALTGLCGLGLYDFLTNPVKKALPFLGILLAMIVAHGAYDFMASIPGVPILSLGSMIAFMLVSLFFFRTLRGLRDGATDQISIGGTFVVGISILAGCILIFAAREISFIPAVISLAVTMFGMVMVGYMFYWQLGEGMSAIEEVPERPYYS